jgi:hypothetical protein
MAFGLEDVVEFPLDEFIVFDHHQNALDILLLLIADVPLALQEVLLRNVEASTKILYLLVRFVFLDKSLEFSFRIVLIDADDCELQSSWNLFDLVGVGLHMSERTLIRIDNFLRFAVEEHFEDRIFCRQHQRIIKNLLIVVVTSKVIDCRHLKLTIIVIEEDFMSINLCFFGIDHNCLGC